MKKTGLGMLLIGFTVFTFGQEIRRDKGQMVVDENPFWKDIKKSSEAFRTPQEKPEEIFQMDVSGIELPTGLDGFKTVWHFEPISQGWTGTCWSFSATSYLESECFRLTGAKIPLSQIHTVYWEYVEKAREFVKTRGKSAFEEGSEDNAVLRMWKLYGCVPLEACPGLKKEQIYHDHSVLFKDMEHYLQSVERDGAWNETIVLGTIKSILNDYLGEPVEKFEYQGKTYTPKTFLEQVVKLNVDDYVDFISLKSLPYYTKGEYDVPDNWWHSGDYHNIPLDVFMQVIRDSLGKGYSVCLGGDTSESGYLPRYDVAMIPSYDIPSEYIDEDARQFRFSNKTTTDDHGIHLVGFREFQGQTWYLIKDSGSGSRNGNIPGYYFYHEDYVKLKMMNFLIHRSAVEEILKRFK